MQIKQPESTSEETADGWRKIAERLQGELKHANAEVVRLQAVVKKLTVVSDDKQLEQKAKKDAMKEAKKEELAHRLTIGGMEPTSPFLKPVQHTKTNETPETAAKLPETAAKLPEPAEETAAKLSETASSWYRSRGFDQDPKRGLRIDLILSSQSLLPRMIDAGIDVEARGLEKPSDHCPVWADFELS